MVELSWQIDQVGLLFWVEVEVFFIHFWESFSTHLLMLIVFDFFSSLFNSWFQNRFISTEQTKIQTKLRTITNIFFFLLILFKLFESIVEFNLKSSKDDFAITILFCISLHEC